MFQNLPPAAIPSNRQDHGRVPRLRRRSRRAVESVAPMRPRTCSGRRPPKPRPKTASNSAEPQRAAEFSSRPAVGRLRAFQAAVAPVGQAPEFWTFPRDFIVSGFMLKFVGKSHLYAFARRAYSTNLRTSWDLSRSYGPVNPEPRYFLDVIWSIIKRQPVRTVKSLPGFSS